MTLILILFWGIIWGFATKAVIVNKGYKKWGTWFLLGFFFGILAFVIACCKPNVTKPIIIKDNPYDKLPYEELMEKGDALIRLGDFNTSEAIFAKLIDRYPGRCLCYMKYLEAATHGFNIETIRDKMRVNEYVFDATLNRLQTFYYDLSDEDIAKIQDFYTMVEDTKKWIRNDLAIRKAQQHEQDLIAALVIIIALAVIAIMTMLFN